MIENTEGDASPEDKPDYWPMVPGYRSIPREFHSLLEGPFAKCMLCEEELAQPARRYFVERIFRGEEPIVEYAMCLNCQECMSSELSEDSQRNIQQFFEQVDYESRVERLRAHVKDVGVEAWIDTCLVTGKRREECRGYQIVGLCQGAELELSIAPFMLSDEAVEEVMKVISKQTRERLDDFMGDHFGMPPEFCERPDFFPVLI
jgi:hypothetical protein